MGRRLFYLLRHTQSENNKRNADDKRTAAKTGISGRQADPELSSLGVQQATEAASALSQTASHPDPTKRITDVFVSPMKRTLCTAQPLKKKLPTASFHLHLDIFEEGGLFAGERTNEGGSQATEAPVEHGQSYDTLRGMLEFVDIVGAHGRERPPYGSVRVRACVIRITVMRRFSAAGDQSEASGGW